VISEEIRIETKLLPCDNTDICMVFLRGGFVLGDAVSGILPIIKTVY